MKLSEQNSTFPTSISIPTRSRKTVQLTLRALFVALAAVFLISATACEEQSKFDEAVEEVKDEASDLKKNIKDEIDDHS